MTDLLTQVDQLVLVQTNVFIRELLRELGKTPGANKEEFRVGLAEAIGEGTLTQDVLDTWLRGVEGWGNQHIYAFEIPTALRRLPLWRDEAGVARVAENTFPGTWRSDTSNAYPDDPTLTRIDYDPGRKVLLVEWHERTDSWTRDESKDERRTIDGDRYWLKAFRLQPSRSVTRFALLLDPAKVVAGTTSKPLAALLLRVAVRSSEHAKAIELAWADLAKLDLGPRPLREQLSPWHISNIIKRLDDEVVQGTQLDFTSKKTRFAEGEGEVEFITPASGQLPDNIRTARVAIPHTAFAPDYDDFQGSSGDFRMNKVQRATSREAHVELFQADNRMRIWTELDEADVWRVLTTFDRYR